MCYPGLKKIKTVPIYLVQDGGQAKPPAEYRYGHHGWYLCRERISLRECHLFLQAASLITGRQEGSPEKILKDIGRGIREVERQMDGRMGVSLRREEGVKIDSSTVGMESARSYRASATTIRRFVISDYQEELTQGNNALNTAIGGDTGSTQDAQGEESDTAQAGKAATTTLQDWQARFQATASNITIRSSVSRTYADIRQQSIRYIFDLLFGARRNRLSRWMEENSSQATGVSAGQTTQTASYSGTAGASDVSFQNGFLIMQPRSLVTTMKVLDYSQETISIEKEDTSFSTVGTVKTADGREINFNVNVGMSREFQERYQEDLQLASFTMCDPLVINLDTDVASLSDQTFYFDIDADGELDEISQLGSGSGYLALDKNGDGTINDGSELFGTSSGNGFADLAKYDEDGNGWIDENDAIWDQLKIWAKDENGKDVLYKLADKGVGAICLQNVATDFTQKGQNGQTLGAIRNSGVFLYEDGNVGTVQHVDVAKYNKEA